MSKQISKQDRNRNGVSGCHYRVLIRDFYDFPPEETQQTPEKKELALFYVMLFTLSCSVGPH